MKNGITWLINSLGTKKSIKVAKSFQRVFDIKDEDITLILEDLANYCNFNQSSFSINENQMAFNEGARDVFLHILEMTQIKPEEILQVINNHQGE